MSSVLGRKTSLNPSMLSKLDMGIGNEVKSTNGQIVGVTELR